MNTLVSVGVPVRNGGSTLDKALQTLVKQTYDNIEIVISDNCSEDDTAEICKRFQNEYGNIKYIRQDKLLSASENFNFVAEASNGKYFMWAAYDDLRTDNYIEVLIRGFKANPNASIAFSNVAEFSDYSKVPDLVPMDYFFQSKGLGFYAKLKKYVRFNCHQIYGLMKREDVLKNKILELDHGPDTPFLLGMLMMGDFVYSKGAMFYYYLPTIQKTPQLRAKENYNRELKPFPELRLSWASALTVKKIETLYGRRRNLVVLFLYLYFCRHWGWLKPAIYNLMPKAFQNFWKILKYRKIENH